MSEKGVENLKVYNGILNGETQSHRTANNNNSTNQKQSKLGNSNDNLSASKIVGGGRLQFYKGKERRKKKNLIKCLSISLSLSHSFFSTHTHSGSLYNFISAVLCYFYIILLYIFCDFLFLHFYFYTPDVGCASPFNCIRTFFFFSFYQYAKQIAKKVIILIYARVIFP